MSVFLMKIIKNAVEFIEKSYGKNRFLYNILSIFANVFTFFEEFVIIQR